MILANKMYLLSLNNFCDILEKNCWFRYGIVLILGRTSSVTKGPRAITCGMHRI